jgi:hypothetical protein
LSYLELEVCLLDEWDGDELLLMEDEEKTVQMVDGEEIMEEKEGEEQWDGDDVLLVEDGEGIVQMEEVKS